MADLPPGVAGQLTQVWTAYRLAVQNGTDETEAAVALGDAIFALGREYGAGDMERIEREARADSFEEAAAMLLRRANEVRGDVGLEMSPMFGRGSASRRKAELALALRDVAAHGGRADVFIPASRRGDEPEHRYWSTHCRHDRHEDCSATEIRRGDGVVPKAPAQCKTCAAQCVCPCHQEADRG